MEQTYKDIVIEQLAYRVAELENYIRQISAQNEQLKKELSEAVSGEKSE